jgi:hypothetical protein
MLATAKAKDERRGGYYYAGPPPTAPQWVSSTGGGCCETWSFAVAFFIAEERNLSKGQPRRLAGEPFHSNKRGTRRLIRTRVQAADLSKHRSNRAWQVGAKATPGQVRRTVERGPGVGIHLGMARRPQGMFWA